MILGIASKAISTFSRQKKSKAWSKALLVIRKHQNFQVNRLEYLEEALTLYDMYSTNSIGEIVDNVNHLLRNLFKHKEMVCGRW